MKILLPLLAAVTLLAVGFVLVELHAPIAPPADATSPPPPIAPPPPVAPPAAPPPSRPIAPLAPTVQAPVAPPVAPSNDPLDVVVRGKTRRQWHAYYTERQQQIAVEIQRHQAIIDRAIAGEEPDPVQLGNAHDKVRELNAQLKEDLEALQQIDGTP